MLSGKNIKKNKDIIKMEIWKIGVIGLFLIFFISLSGCTTQQQQEKGIKIDLIEGAGYISNGKTILENELFRIGLKITNYDEKEKRGMICVYDDQNEYYGGIGKECKEFYVGKSFKDKEIVPSTVNVFFPEQGYYKYIRLPFDISPEIFLETIYNQDTTFTSSLTYPTPEIQSFSFSDEFLSLYLEKSIHTSEQGYEIFLKIDIKKNKEVNLSYNQQKGIFFSIEARPVSFNCNTPLKQFSNSAFIDLERENFIRCNAFTPSGNYESLPLQINLKYQALEKNKIKINVKKK